MNKGVFSGTWCAGGLFHEAIAGSLSPDSARGKLSLIGGRFIVGRFLWIGPGGRSISGVAGSC
jgi:hypothetical protein